jgi:hypothetical protein
MACHLASTEVYLERQELAKPASKKEASEEDKAGFKSHNLSGIDGGVD